MNRSHLTPFGFIANQNHRDESSVRARLTKKLVMFLLLLMGFGSLSAAGLNSSGSSDYYEKGLPYRNVEEYAKALEVWATGQRELEKQGLSDLRIAFGFIELATEQELKEYYERASEIYFWGLSEQAFHECREAFGQEVERVLPLVSAEEGARWRKLVESGDSQIGQELRQFWIERDPIISSVTNERLIEHWERVGYARQHFTKSNATVYRTDDRGLIYVKFGEPDLRREITLGNNTTELMTWAGLADFGGSGFFANGVGRKFSQLRNAMEFYMTYPQCEVWIYQSLGTVDPVVFLFGPDDGLGSFGLREGVEDLIPSTAFSKVSARRTGGLVPGALLQLMYYNRLSLYDRSFEGRYSELESVWLRAQQFAEKARAAGMTSSASSYIRNTLYKELRGVRNRFDVEDTFDRTKKYMATERSDYDLDLNRIDFIAYGTRILDEANQPETVVIAFEFEKIFRRGQSFKLPSYQFDHKLTIHDSDWQELEQHQGTPIHDMTNTVVYRLPHLPSHAHYTISVETILKDPEEDVAVTDSILSAGQVFLNSEEVLDPDLDKLEASDLVLGIRPPKSLKEVELPFPVVPSSKVWKMETLQAYLELYHLKLREDGVGHYALDFRVTRLEPDGDDFKREEMVATSFEFDASDRTVKETFSIDVSTLDAGEYEMTVEIHDQISDQKKRRSKRFRVVERE